MKKTDRYVVVLAYDFAGETIHDKEMMEWKGNRDGYTASDSILLICWSKKRETIQLSDRLLIESFPAFAGRFRPLYDILFIAVAPVVMWRRGWRPDMIVIAEWPLAWGAAVIKLFFGGEIVMRLIGLPRHIARTRSIFHYFYTVVCESLARYIPDRCIAISDATAQYAIDRGLPRDRVSMLPLDSIRSDSGLIDAAKTGQARIELGIPKDIPFVLSVGRLEDEKAFDELIDVFAESGVNAWLVILGEGSLRPQLEARARKYPNVKILLPGKKSRADIWRYFKDASAFALLSKSEGLGLVFWEAMYMGVPVIGRPVGGILDTIGSDGERGFFWDTKDTVTVFAEKLSRCFQKHEDVKAMVLRAHAYVESRIEEMSGERPF